MIVKEVPLNDLIPYGNNPRHNEDAVGKVAKSIEEFGFQQPIVVDKDMVIIVGHTRCLAAKRLGLKTVPVVVAEGLSEQKVRAYRLADNKVSEFTNWDWAKLDEELEALANDSMLEDFDMTDFGFPDVSIAEGEAVQSDEFGTEFELPDGEKPETCSMTFHLYAPQKALIEQALLDVGAPEETFGNTNKNGNALYEVVRQWAELKK